MDQIRVAIILNPQEGGTSSAVSSELPYRLIQLYT